MSKILEIIKSGKPPGYPGGSVDPQSVFALAPKAFKEIERGEGRSRGTGPMSARDMAKYMGLGTVSQLKKTWEKTNSRAFSAIAALCLLAQSCFGQSQLFSIPSPYPIQDGVQLHAANFNNAMQFLQPTPFFITSWTVDTTPLSGDQFLVYSQNGVYQRLSLGALLTSGAQFVLYPLGTPSYVTNDLFSFFNQTQQAINTVSFSSLVGLVINDYGYTNLQTMAAPISGLVTNQPSNTANTNFPTIPIWGTNGVIKSVPLSTLEASIGFDSLFQPYLYGFAFQPWLYYKTNSTANPWGSFTNFPITHLTMAGTNLPTLTSTDSIPINSFNQGTNTTVNLQAIYEYMTNLNALPAYTQARANVSGIPVQVLISNISDTVNNLLQVPTNSFISPNVYAVSAITNGNTIKMWGGAQSNTVFWVVPRATNNAWVYIYTNYYNAFYGTNNLTSIQTGSGAQCKFNYVTNYTSFNADVTPTTAGLTTITGYYDVWFRSPAPTPFYYVTGTAEQVSASHTVVFDIGFDNIVNTNEVRVTVMNEAAAYQQPPLMHILISPQ